MAQITTPSAPHRQTFPGQIYTLTVSPNFAEDGVCFAACEAGLYRSDDGARTWQSAYDSLQLDSALMTTAVAISPGFSSDHSVFAGAQGGILRSGDGGATWQGAILPEPPPLISTLAPSPHFVNDGALFAGTFEDGVFRSTDRGLHWTASNFGLLDWQILSMAISPDFAHDDTIFVGVSTGIFRSTNGGRAWRDLELPEGVDMGPILSLALSPGYASDGTLFAGTESCGLWTSPDRGQTWTRLDNGVIDDPINGIILAPTFPDSGVMLLVLGESLLISPDRGQSWSERAMNLTVEQGVAVVTAPHGLTPESALLIGLVEGSVAWI